MWVTKSTHVAPIWGQISIPLPWAQGLHGCRRPNGGRKTPKGLQDALERGHRLPGSTPLSWEQLWLLFPTGFDVHCHVPSTVRGESAGEPGGARGLSPSPHRSPGFTG